MFITDQNLLKHIGSGKLINYKNVGRIYAPTKINFKEGYFIDGSYYLMNSQLSIDTSGERTYTFLSAEKKSLYEISQLFK
jgi:hypothetical protein